MKFIVDSLADKAEGKFLIRERASRRVGQYHNIPSMGVSVLTFFACTL